MSFVSHVTFADTVTFLLGEMIADWSDVSRDTCGKLG